MTSKHALKKLRMKVLSRDEDREWFAIIGGIGVLAFLFIGIFGPLLAPYPTDEIVGQPFEPPSDDHLLGTDDMGHDIFSWLVVGARASLVVGIVAGSLAILIGLVVGVTAGVVGGKVETVLMRFIDIMLTVPFLPLIIVVAAVFGPGLWTTIGVLAAVMWARPARELRSEVLSIRNREYIEATKSMGASATHLAIKYVVPAVLLIAIAQFARVVSIAILLEAALSFLGLGDPTQASWGTILFYAHSRSAFLTEAWKWWIIPPGLAITLSVLSFIFITLGVERRAGADRRNIATTVPGADFDIVPPGHVPAVEADGPDGDDHIDTGDGIDTGDRVGANDGVKTTTGPKIGPGPEPGSILEVADLTVDYGTPSTVAVAEVDVALYRDELLGVVGESGSGKSSFALALIGLLREPGRVTDGKIRLYTDHEYPPDVEIADIRGDELTFVPQEAMNALDPRLRLQAQLSKLVRVQQGCPAAEAKAQARETLKAVGLPPESHDRYPFELSGGMRQRGVIAMALVNDPSALVVDEPTTGLDMVTKVGILALLEDIQATRDLSVIVISHDLEAVTSVADRIAVMKDGQFVEIGETDRLQTNPEHPYTRELLSSRIALPSADSMPTTEATVKADPHLVFEGISKEFGNEEVLDGVDFTLDRGQSVALLGESGAGKSTLGRMALGLIRPDTGTIQIEKQPVAGWDRRDLGRKVHYIFQDPYSSLAPNRRINHIVREPLDIHGLGDDSARQARVHQALNDVELTPTETYARRYPSELSGGQRQRVAFARALVLEPPLLIADEPTSMLDAPLQQDLLELLYDLIADHGITLLHITHDIAQASTFAEELAILHAGEIVEQGSVASILRNPEHEQTRTLLEATKALSQDAGKTETDFPPANQQKRD
jgi:ABC-type glutathione transport system ATPase component/ABC-type dipeptide/oligopeptide/nickel transport system permease subunit